MSNIIKSHAFEKQQNKLKEFSNNFPQKTNFETFKEDGGLFNLFDTKVTGRSLNKFVGDVSDEFIQQKNISIKIIEEFKTIYDTFEKLDKDYIQSIIIAVNSAKSSSNQALKNTEDIGKLLEGTQKLTKNLQEKFSVLEKKNTLLDENYIKINELEKENKKNINYLKANDIKIIEITDNYNYLKNENKALTDVVSNLEEELSKLEKRKSSDNSLKISILTCMTILAIIISLVTMYLLFN